jgi:Fe2+ transport system protein FeoA
MTATATVPLGTLAIGESAVVARVACARPVARRLLEMGLLPGTRVTVVRVAPLGDPIELSLRGYALSIRRAEAMAIDVTRASVETHA